MAKLALIRCESYDEEAVSQAVDQGLSLLGGPEKFVRPGETLLIKPNLLAGDAPEKSVTTHPAVFRAVCQAFLTAGATLSYGDSPAIGKTERAAKKAGLASVAEELGIPLADFTTGVDLFFDKGIQNKRFTLAKAVLAHDGLISLPKLKTHGLERFTGAVKNQFGCIPGVLKGEFHLKLPDADQFAKMLVDLNRCISPRLYIMDGISAMEGNGPRGGTPRKMNVLLISDDPVALDATVCRMVHLNPEHVPTIRYGMQAGMGTSVESEIQLLGHDINEFYTEDFKIDRKPLPSSSRGVFSGFVNQRLVSKPYIKADRCIRCGVCVDVCPVKPRALFFNDQDRSNPPVYNDDLCIRCLCCQELCPESAIVLKTPLMRKLINRI